VVYVEKPRISQRRIVVGSGYVTMSINTFCSPMLEIAAIVTIVYIPYAVIITVKNIPAIGKPAHNAKVKSNPRCMHTMAPMNTILKNWKIRPSMNPPGAQNARRLSP
jgi:hypothetical protein